ncbi:MAG: hypothetical protein ACM33T_15650 [Solirubrobacterales bacterium]
MMTFRRSLMLSATLTAAMAASNAWAGERAGELTTAQSQWGAFSLSSGVTYSTGDYGESQRTNILYVPLTGKLELQDWVFKLTVPYISVTGPGNVVQGVGVVGAAGGRRTTESGLGDVVAAVTKTVYEDSKRGTAIDVTGKIKFGTADADRGLGTGENDYSLAVEPSQQVGPVTLFATLGYKVVGDPEGTDLNNVAFGSLGGSTHVTPATTAGLVLDFQERSSPTSSPPRELTAFATSRLDDRWKGQAYLSRGLSDASPDWGGGLMASYAF